LNIAKERKVYKETGDIFEKTVQNKLEQFTRKGYSKYSVTEYGKQQ
jgi:hypothetical protein